MPGLDSRGQRQAARPAQRALRGGPASRHPTNATTMPPIQPMPTPTEELPSNQRQSHQELSQLQRDAVSAECVVGHPPSPTPTTPPTCHTHIHTHTQHTTGPTPHTHTPTQHNWTPTPTHTHTQHTTAPTPHTHTHTQHTTGPTPDTHTHTQHTTGPTPHTHTHTQQTSGLTSPGKSSGGLGKLGAGWRAPCGAAARPAPGHAPLPPPPAGTGRKEKRRKGKSKKGGWVGVGLTPGELQPGQCPPCTLPPPAAGQRGQKAKGAWQRQEGAWSSAAKELRRKREHIELIEREGAMPISTQTAHEGISKEVRGKPGMRGSRGAESQPASHLGTHLEGEGPHCEA